MTLIYEPGIGEDIQDALRKAVVMARENECEVCIDFNTTRITVNAKTDWREYAILYTYGEYGDEMDATKPINLLVLNLADATFSQLYYISNALRDAADYLSARIYTAVEKERERRNAI